MSLSPLGRIIEIAEEGRYLSKARGFLVVSHGGEEMGRVPLDDITAVVATAPSTVVSCALLTELADRGVSFVVVGRNFAPAAVLWPIDGYHAQQRRMEAQTTAPQALKRLLWRDLVAAKLRRQGRALSAVGKPAGAFIRLARAVEPGDESNREAQGARRYWKLMMGTDFRRDPHGDGANALLNYGYAILRAATGRAISAAGLHPGLGIFHRHPQNPMPLADDLMEPFRPLVDLTVIRLIAEGCATVTPAAKRVLAGLLHAEELTDAGRTPLNTCLQRLAASVGESFVTGSPALYLPKNCLE